MGGHTALVLIVLIVLIAGIALFSGAFYRAIRNSNEQTRPVLPSHYYSLFHSTPSADPDRCPQCGTRNDSDYDYCRECAAELPDSPDRPRTEDGLDFLKR